MENNDALSLSAEQIVSLLQEPIGDRRPLKRKLQYLASVKELVRALQITEIELTRRILCDILGSKRAKTAIPVLIDCLDDPSPWVKDAAAEALGKIGSQKAGKSLLEHFQDAPNLWFGVALGAINYRPAIPYLIEALFNSSDKIRGGAAWSLGKLGAMEAIDALENALAKEYETYPKKRMKEALEVIKGNRD